MHLFLSVLSIPVSYTHLDVYKRQHLLFTDLERLSKIVNNPDYPVQFLFAGKAHPPTGMERYLNAAGIAREDSIAVGDGPNDLQMMEYAGIGIAMGNAIEEVKERADMVTSSINNDGIYRAFETLGLLA